MGDPCKICGRPNGGFISIWGVFCSPDSWMNNRCAPGGPLDAGKPTKGKKKAKKPRDKGKARKAPRKKKTEAEEYEEAMKRAAANCYANLANL